MEIAQLFMWAIFVILCLGAPAFWLWMLADAALHERKGERVVWVAMIAILNILGAVVYYLARRTQREYGLR